MTKFFKIIVFIGGFFFLMVSCDKANTLTSTKTSSENIDQEVTITPDVKMVLIKAGEYQPFYGEDSTLVKVDDFLLDERPVTNAEFLDFVKKNPKWKRSNVKTAFADDA